MRYRTAPLWLRSLVVLAVWLVGTTGRLAEPGHVVWLTTIFK